MIRIKDPGVSPPPDSNPRGPAADASVRRPRVILITTDVNEEICAIATEPVCENCIDYLTSPNQRRTAVTLT